MPRGLERERCIAESHLWGDGASPHAPCLHGRDYLFETRIHTSGERPRLEGEDDWFSTLSGVLKDLSVGAGSARCQELVSYAIYTAWAADILALVYNARYAEVQCAGVNLRVWPLCMQSWPPTCRSNILISSST